MIIIHHHRSRSVPGDTVSFSPVEVKARNEIGLLTRCVVFGPCSDRDIFAHGLLGLTHAGTAFNSSCPSSPCHPCPLPLTMVQTHPLPQFNDARMIYVNSSYRAYAVVQSLSQYSSNTLPSFARIWRPSRTSLKYVYAKRYFY
jgi:hypothetical protein